MNTNLLELLARPGAFFAALKNLPPINTRYLWLVLLTWLVTGRLAGALAAQAAQQAFQGVPGLPGGGVLTAVISVAGSIILMLVLWLMLWGLGSLGAGKEGRAAEVFSATFLPSLILALVLLPITALFPAQITVAAPNFGGLEGPELARAAQNYSAAVQREVAAQPLSHVSSVLSYAAFAW